MEKPRAKEGVSELCSRRWTVHWADRSRETDFLEKPKKAKMASSSVTQNPVAEDGSLSPRNWPVKENNLSINSIIAKNDMMT